MAIKSFTRSTIENNIFYRSMLAGNTAYQPSDEDILAEEILTSSQASVTFSSLGDYATAGYQHLQIRTVTRSIRSADSDAMDLRFNSDSGTSYYSHHMRGNGSSVASFVIASRLTTNIIPAASEVSGDFDAKIIDILDPFDSSKNTTIRTLWGHTGSLNNFVCLSSGAWFNTAAVTTISVDCDISSFATGSRFTLIGLK